MIGVGDQIMEFLNGLWQRRWHAVIISWAVCVFGWMGVASLPDEYEVSTRIYVDTTSLLRPLLRGIAVEPDVGSEVRLIRQTLLSRSNIEEVIRLTDLDLNAETREEKEGLIQLLDAKTNLSSIAREANLFSITYSDSNPTRARDVVEAFTTVLVETNLGQGRSDADVAQEFLDEQIKVFREQLEDSEKALADFELENGRFLPQSASASLSSYLQAEASLKDAQAKRDVLQRQLSQISPFVEVAAGGFGEGPPSDTQLQIAQLEAGVETLLAQYTEQHPDVVVARRRLEALKDKAEATRANISGGPLGGGSSSSANFRESNPVYDELKIELVKTESEIGALEQQHERLRVEWFEVKAQIEQTPFLEAEKKKLLRDYGAINEKYQQLLSRSQSSKISIERTVKADNVKFRIIDPPIVPTAPVGPKRVLFMTVVLVFGLGVGLMVPSLMVISKETLQGVRALRGTFSIPVFGSIQDMTGINRPGFKYLQAGGVMVAMGILLAIFIGLVVVETRVGLQSFVSAGGPLGVIAGLKQLIWDVFAILKSKV